MVILKQRNLGSSCVADRATKVLFFRSRTIDKPDERSLFFLSFSGQKVAHKGESMCWQADRGLSFTIVLFALCVIAASCRQNDVNGNDTCGFSPVEDEQVFWNKWVKEHGNNRCHLEPFFGAGRETYWRQVDGKSLPMSKASGTFALVIEVNMQNSLLVAVALGNGKEAVKWDLSDGTVKESFGNVAVIPDDIWESLTNTDVFADGSAMSCDATSVYVFVTFHDKCSRYAVYDAPFVFGKNQRDPATVPLESLFRAIGTAEIKKCAGDMNSEHKVS